MSLNKNTVQQYIDGFDRSDHAQILSCLTDDIEWLMPGTFRVAGKAAFDKEIENEATPGSCRGIGDGPLVQLDVHLSPRFVQGNLTATQYR